MITRDQAIERVEQALASKVSNGTGGYDRLITDDVRAAARRIIDALGVWYRPYEKGQYVTITMPDREPQVFKIADVDPDGTCHLVRGDFDRPQVQLSFDTPWL